MKRWPLVLASAAAVTVGLLYLAFTQDIKRDPARFETLVRSHAPVGMDRKTADGEIRKLGFQPVDWLRFAPASQIETSTKQAIQDGSLAEYRMTAMANLFTGWVYFLNVRYRGDRVSEVSLQASGIGP